jgi:beta-lactamase regulating signal transducer with metallopeptidase domain
MIGTVVSAALWAIVASLALSIVLGAAVALTIRLVRPAASTRQALWSVALGFAGFAPVAILAVMLVRGALPETSPLPATGTAVVSAAPATAHGAAAGPMLPASGAGHAALRLPEPPAIAPLVARAIIAVWLLGAFAGLVGLVRSLLRVRALKLRSSGLDGDLATELPWLTESPGREIYLRLSYETETPIAVGFRRPVILIPTEMATAAGLTSIEPLVMHEYAHLARYDDWTNLAQRTIERVFWFNPLVWILGRRVALEREVAADEAVVERTHDAKNYASALWRMAQEMRMPEHVVVAPGAMLTRKQISVRIERLLEDGPLGRRFSAAALAASLVALSAVAAVAASAPPIMLADDAAPPVAAATSAPAPASPLGVQRNAAHAIAAHIAATQIGAAHAVAASVSAAVAAAGAAAAKAQKIVADSVPTSPAMPPSAPAIPAIPPIPALHDGVSRNTGKGWLSRDAVAGCIGCDFSRHDLRGIDLSGLSLMGDDFSHANLEGANLSHTSLKGISFAHAQLAHADLRSANLTGVDFAHADLTNADLTDATLTGSDLSDAVMDGANTTRIHLIGSELP